MENSCILNQKIAWFCLHFYFKPEVNASNESFKIPSWQELLKTWPPCEQKPLEANIASWCFRAALFISSRIWEHSLVLCFLCLFRIYITERKGYQFNKFLELHVVKELTSYGYNIEEHLEHFTRTKYWFPYNLRFRHSFIAYFRSY